MVRSERCEGIMPPIGRRRLRKLGTRLDQRRHHLVVPCKGIEESLRFTRMAGSTPADALTATANVPRFDPSTGRSDKASDQYGDLIRGGVQREMAAIDNVNLGSRHIPTIGFRLRRVERGFILTPDHQ